MASTVETINTEILPVIQSLSKEFSKNSGKSIMDRISRIDDNTRLAELRSKLIASNLIATGMIEFDRAGRLTWANKALINMCGVSMDELRNNGWTIIIEEEDRNHVWELWQTSLKHDIPFESEFILKNQSTNIQKAIKCTIYPHKSVEGSVLGYYGTIIEVP
jgi:PAS domain S-box-containing protein